ncbi:hypothetical protein [Bdellovibrio bacteriovorus]|uniref:hypothetical protein n=1 Tax=Bdellovibrio bacteriovorus TaxID=959 RepID=UPI0035A714AD
MKNSVKFLERKNCIEVLKRIKKDNVSLLLGKSHKRGTEKILQDSFLNEISPKFVVKINVNGKEYKVSNLTAERKLALLDAVVDNKHVIEFKVVRLPRLIRLSANDALYDLGQILSDIARSHQSKAFASVTSYILLHGGLIADMPSERHIERELHNRLYIDFQTSLLYGEFGRESTTARKIQIRMAKELNLHLPYSKKRSQIKVYRLGDLAIALIRV